ncbi:MAG TPA: MarR family transcriptional regulator [Pilimelia sp.]|nr:MarR family transcriptional regulator [Pilimelia sp.]
MGKRDEQAVQHYVEHLAMTLYELGFPRMPARVLCALVVAEDGALTAGQIGQWLGVSPAAVSGAIRYLVQIGMVQREPVPGSRSDRYRAMSNTWYIAGVARRGVYKRVADVVAEGVTVVGEDTEAGARIAEMAEFFRFMQDELAAMVEKWNASRG